MVAAVFKVKRVVIKPAEIYAAMLVRPEKGHDFSLRINGFKKLAAGAYFCSAAELFVVGKKSFPFFKACFFGIFSESGIKRAGLVRFSDSDQFLQRHPVYRAFEDCLLC